MAGVDSFSSSDVGGTPAPAVTPSPAPGLRGPRGLSPRQNYSRVNTSVPGSADAGALEQKTIMPKVGADMSITMATKPRALNDMLKTAMASTLGRTKIAQAARQQLQSLEAIEGGQEKEAEDPSVTTEYVLKLAAATDYLFAAVKEGSMDPGEGPGALSVGDNMREGPALHTNSGKAHMQVPASVVHGTQLVTDENSPAAAGEPSISAALSKSAAPIELLRKAAAGAPVAEEAGAPISILRKMADTLQTTDVLQDGPPAKNKNLVPATAQGVADLTPRQTQAPVKAEMAAVLKEPMQSAKGDTVLQQAFSHTDEAGAKIGHEVKLAAAKALLRSLAEGAA